MGSPASDNVLSNLAEPATTTDSTTTETEVTPTVTETLPTPTAKPLNEVVGDNEK